MWPPLLCRLLAASTDPTTGLPNVAANPGQVTSALKIVFGVIGTAALIFVIIGGLTFITAQGDPQSTAKARNTIIYAVVGLVIAISAEAIITFVIGKL